MYKKYFKHLIDIILIILVSVIALPVMLLTALLVLIYLGRPIFFKQARPGLHGKIFTIYKFRTMRNIYDTNGKLLPDEQRLTKFGKFLRRYSLDELPELFNVLKGDMSLVGPRPLLVEYLPLYTPEQMHRHDVRPGLTGWAQINGRNAINWQEKFALDIWYVNNMSLLLDLKILGLTLIKVSLREGIGHHGHATMEKFNGK